MKKIFFLISLLLSTLSSIGQTCPVVTTTSGSVTCTSPCTTITANATPIYATTAYSVSSTTYSPFSFTTGTSVSTSSDDIFTTAISLPFCFEFFGTTYNTVYIGSNGNISFNSAVSGGYDPWTVPTGGIPSTTSVDAHRNCIMGTWCDMYPPGGGTIKYNTYGTTPCRVFVVSYYNIPIFGSCGSTKDTTQIAIYETSNIIDVYICSHNIPLCTSWNGGRAVTGIENASGSSLYTVTGQNGSAFSASHQGWRFSPTGTAYTWTYTWSGSSGIIGVGSTQSVCPTTTTTYSVVASTTTSCGTINLPSVTSTVTSIATIVSIGGDSILCQGETSLLTASLSGGSWTSSNPSVATVNSSGLVTGVSAGFATITYTIAAGCQGTKLVKVNPVYSTSFSDYVCDGNTYTFGGNNYTIPGSYTHTFTTINGCDSNVTLNLTVRPLPTLNFTHFASKYCIGDTIGVALTSHSSDITDYYWNFTPATVVTSSSSHGGPYGIVYPTAGIYTITAQATNGFCLSSIMVDTISIGDYPNAQIGPFDDNVCFGDRVRFSIVNWNDPRNFMNYYHWQPDGVFQYVLNSDWHESSKIGVIDSSTWIWVVATTPFGCETTDSVYINSHSCCQFMIPTAFTPNEDGLNDRFRPNGDHVLFTNFIIVNRWGQTVYESYGKNISGWDGKFNGENQDLGTYFWMLKYECDGKIKSEKGDVTLVR